jgi:hypothetical protein
MTTTNSIINGFFLFINLNKDNLKIQSEMKHQNNCLFENPLNKTTTSSVTNKLLHGHLNNEIKKQMLEARKHGWILKGGAHHL